MIKPVIGHKIWPCFDFLEKHFSETDSYETAQDLINKKPIFQQAIQLVDEALVEANTAGYPRSQLSQYKQTLSSALHQIDSVENQ